MKMIVCVVGCVVMVVAGCREEPVSSYKVSKTQTVTDPEGMPAGLPPGHPTGMPAGHPDISTMGEKPSVKWKTPEGWTESPTSGMRVGSFRIVGDDGKQADVSIIPLPGKAGGDSANVNLWRSQVELPPVSEEEIKKLGEAVEVAGQPATFYELAGEAGSKDAARILGVIQHREGIAWFFKMIGDSEFVAKQKQTFLSFLKTIEFGAVESKPVEAAVATAPSAVPGKWPVPAGWREVPGGQFLVAKFVIENEAGRADVNVSSSAGDGGGLAANINRWRQQLGLSPVDNDEVTGSVQTIETKGGKAFVVELSGTDMRSSKPAGVVGVLLIRADKSWFYKLMGDPAVVAGQKDAFIGFAQKVDH